MFSSHMLYVHVLFLFFYLPGLRKLLGSSSPPSTDEKLMKRSIPHRGYGRRPKTKGGGGNWFFCSPLCGKREMPKWKKGKKEFTKRWRISAIIFVHCAQTAAVIFPSMINAQFFMGMAPAPKYFFTGVYALKVTDFNRSNKRVCQKHVAVCGEKITCWLQWQWTSLCAGWVFTQRLFNPWNLLGFIAEKGNKKRFETFSAFPSTRPGQITVWRRTCVVFSSAGR